MAKSADKISESAFKVIQCPLQMLTSNADKGQVWVGILYGTAILAVSMRITLRIHLHRRLFLDDIFLLFACAALTAAIPVLYNVIPPLYIVQGIEEGIRLAQSSGIDVSAEVHLYATLHLIHEALGWAVIFLVKFSFLSFFRQLVDRIRDLVLYWKVVCVMSVVACAFCVGFSFMGCPRTDSTASM